jgi:hypothetical protein
MAEVTVPVVMQGLQLLYTQGKLLEQPVIACSQGVRTTTY